MDLFVDVELFCGRDLKFMGWSVSFIWLEILEFYYCMW